jgi:type I restriction enzyme S subunit
MSPEPAALMEAVDLLEAARPRRFRPYSSYERSGIDWLSDIPSHWAVRKFKHLAHLVTLKHEGEGPKIGMENVESFTGRYLRTEALFEGDGISFQAGDILYGKLRPYLAKVLLADCQGAAVGDFFVLHPRALTCPRYLQYLLLERTFTKLADGSTFGAKMPRVDWTFLGNLKFSIPPREEQRAIAAFLDRETAKIDGLVEKKRRLIELLKEKRTALISLAVTKGLNPAAPMKPSGIDWLGDVPAHWEVLPLKRVLRGIEQGWSPECEARKADPDEWAVMKAGCVNYGVFDESDHKALPHNLEPDPKLEIRPGDLLMSRACGTPELVGSVALVPSCRRRLILCDKLFRLQSMASKCIPQFIYLALNSRMAREQIEQQISGADGLANNITQRTIRGMVAAIPPLEEQAALCHAVQDATRRVDALIDHIDNATRHLVEYRSALISAAVTGKIDVRNATTSIREA